MKYACGNRRLPYTRSMPFELDDVREADLNAVRELNEAVVPAVNSLPLEKFEWFRGTAAYFRVVRGPQGIAGFLVGLRPGTTYESPNYRWFCRHYEDFAYVDRVAVAAHARRAGIAAMLYEDFARHAGDGVPVMTCEVNIEPPNPGSMRFHERMGFRQIGELKDASSGKTVALMEKQL